MKKCPYCAEAIQDEAIVCRFCNRPLDPEGVANVAREANLAGDPPDIGSLPSATNKKSREMSVWKTALRAGAVLAGLGSMGKLMQSSDLISGPYGVGGFLNDLVLSSCINFVFWTLAAATILYIRSKLGTKALLLLILVVVVAGSFLISLVV